MRNNLIVLPFLAFFSSPLFAQSDNIVERVFACDINAGYTINDAVDLMRGYEWEDEYAPGAVFLREAIAVPGDFMFNYDFTISLFYPSYADMVEKRVAFRNRSGGENGMRLRDIADCGERIRINNVRFSIRNDDGIPPDVSVSMAGSCQLNGSTISDALTGTAAIFSQGPMAPNVRSVAVTSRAFGGPTLEANSELGFRVSFNSTTDFGEAMDASQAIPPTPNPDIPVSCNVPGMWAQYLIHWSDS